MKNRHFQLLIYVGGLISDTRWSFLCFKRDVEISSERILDLGKKLHFFKILFQSYTIACYVVFGGCCLFFFFEVSFFLAFQLVKLEQCHNKSGSAAVCGTLWYLQTLLQSRGMCVNCKFTSSQKLISPSHSWWSNLIYH